MVCIHVAEKAAQKQKQNRNRTKRKEIKREKRRNEICYDANYFIQRLNPTLQVYFFRIFFIASCTSHPAASCVSFAVFSQFGFGSIHFVQCHCLFCTKFYNCSCSYSMFHWNGDEIGTEDRKNAAKQYKMNQQHEYNYLNLDFSNISQIGLRQTDGRLRLQPVWIWIWVCVCVLLFLWFFSACFKLEHSNDEVCCMFSNFFLLHRITPTLLLTMFPFRVRKVIELI